MNLSHQWGKPACLLVLSLLLACSPDDSGAANQSATAPRDESQEAATCRMMARTMIDIAREAVADTSSRPERREARRVLMEGWIARLGDGEDPCTVYTDIAQASTTF